MKFCKDCKHFCYLPTYTNPRISLFDDIPETIYKCQNICKYDVSKSYDLITGDVKYKTCEEMRYNEFSYQINTMFPIVEIIRCGKKGRFFIPKE